MSEIGIDGLRQAFLDPGSRIRLNSDPEPGRHSELVAMAWQGGFLDGAAIRFNSNLNVLIGRRGTGKSTVIESLRHVLGLEPIGEEARSSYDGIVRNVLRNGTKISLRIRCHRPNPREYRIERTIPNPSVVRDERTGEVLNLSAADVFPGVEIYGQHEISELAEARSAARAFRGSRRIPRLEEAGAAPAAGAIPQPDTGDPQEACGRQGGTRSPAWHRRDLARYQEAGLEQDLREQSMLVREECVLSSAEERVRPFRGYLDELRQELPVDRVFLSLKALEDLPGRDILAGVDPVLARLDADLEDVLQRLESALNRADQGVERVQEQFESHRDAAHADYQKKLRDLQKDRVDGEEFIQLRRQIEQLHPLRDQQANLGRLEEYLLESRRNLVAEWEDIKAEEFRSLERASKRVRPPRRKPPH